MHSKIESLNYQNLQKNASFDDYFPNNFNYKSATNQNLNYQNLQKIQILIICLHVDLKGKKQLATQQKYYLVDLGLMNILVGKERNTDRGYILENIVYLELLRRGNKIWTGTSRSSEVDFVCKNPIGDIEYYQVAWEISAENTLEREFSALEKLKDNYPKFLLTTDSFTQNRSGIKHINVFNWLLEN